MLSFWEKEQFFAPQDIVIVGAGLVGLNAALKLRQLRPKAKILVLEKGLLPAGASSRNAGFACFGSPGELYEDLKSHSWAELEELLYQRYLGLRLLRETLGDQNIAYQGGGSLELFRAKEEAQYQAILDQLPSFNKRLAPLFEGRSLFSPLAKDALKKEGLQNFSRALENSLEGQIDTGKMMRTLVQRVEMAGISIRWGAELLDWEQGARGLCLALRFGPEQLALYSQQLLICNNGFGPRLLPDLALQPARNQVILSERIPNLALKRPCHAQAGYIYFRPIAGRILLGGGRHLDPLGETTDELGQTAKIQNFLADYLENVLGQKVGISQSWSGILGVGPQKKPLLGQTEEGVYYALRLGGMGVALGSLLGQKAANLLSQ